MAETFWWVLVFGLACALFLSYGVIGDLIRQWRSGRRSRKEPL